MNRKTDKPDLQVLDGGRLQDEADSLQKIISDHFPLIERQCYNAVKRQLKNVKALNNPVHIENEALELSNQVLDTLRRDDYRVLRQFKGNARMSTYIITIIARQAVDLVRKKLGRSREKERAQKFGKTGLLVYERVILQGCSLREIYRELKTADASVSLDQLETIAEKIKGRKGGLIIPPDHNPVVKNGVTTDDEGEFIIPDKGSDPQDLLMEQQRKQKLGEVVKDMISQLSGEERLILRMRFPAHEGEKTGKVERIAAALGISEKAVYKRITRVLKKCRDRLDRQGVSIHDLL